MLTVRKLAMPTILTSLLSHSFVSCTMEELRTAAPTAKSTVDDRTSSWWLSKGNDKEQWSMRTTIQSEEPNLERSNCTGDVCPASVRYFLHLTRWQSHTPLDLITSFSAVSSDGEPSWEAASSVSHPAASAPPCLKVVDGLQVQNVDPIPSYSVDSTPSLPGSSPCGGPESVPETAAGETNLLTWSDSGPAAWRELVQFLDGSLV